MRILITGATGLIGKRLAVRLFEAGHDLVITSRGHAKSGGSSSIAEVFPVPCAVESWDSERTLAPSILNSVDAVIHLAGESIASRWTAAHKERVLRSRVNGTKNLLANAGSVGSQSSPSGVKAVLSASAIGFYGNRGEEQLTESSPAGTGFLADVCRQWEKTLVDAPGTFRRVSMRTGIVLSREGGALAEMRNLFERGLGGRVGNGRQWMSWIHEDDLIEMFVYALQDPKLQGPLNAVSPHPARNQDFTAELARSLHRPKLLPVPAPLLRLALGEMSALVLDSQKVEPTRAQQAGFRWRYPNLAEALADLCTVNGDPRLQKYEHKSWIPTPPEKLFPFFSDPKNLERLTPPAMSLRFKKSSTASLQPGTQVDYLMKIKGVPLRWRSKIESVDPGKSFVDSSRQGPYAYWQHTHELQPLRGGTLLVDRIIYCPRLSPLSQVLGGNIIAGALGELFQFRTKVLRQEFSLS